jgi:putative oxidoreductase
MKLGITILRAALGSVFIFHGTQKLFGWFGGPGPEGMGKGFEQMGIRPGKRAAIVAGAAETGGGALMAGGLMVPVGAAGIVAVMQQAVRTIHWEKGFSNTGGGYEYNLVLACAALAIADTGPGPLSLDRALGIRMSGPAWALAALGAGVAGPLLFERMAPVEEPPAPEEPSRFARDTEQAPAQASTA